MRNAKIKQCKYVSFLKSLILTLQIYSIFQYVGRSALVESICWSQLKTSRTKAKHVSQYDQEIPQSQTADRPMTPQRRATQQSRDTLKAD